ncbi:MAG: winged helix-turn-helix transcriptional regulator [Asgard group archaeon]|nr:winged helix-turn-helix transcriptional regulator [Asgard group archaeon]
MEYIINMEKKEMPESKISDDIRKKYEEVVYDEVKYGIISAIIWYDSLNLKNLARLLGRPETTIIRYTKKLLEEGLIDVDAEKTASSWGKFYKLSSGVKKLYEEEMKALEMREESILKEYETLKNKNEDELYRFLIKQILSKENFEIAVQAIRQNLTLSYNIQNMIVNEVVSALDNLTKLVDEKGKDYIEENLIIDPSDVEIYNVSLSLSNTKQLLRLVETFNNFHKELIKLKNEFEKEMDQDGISKDNRKLFYTYLFMGSLDFNARFKNEK